MESPETSTTSLSTVVGKGQDMIDGVGSKFGPFFTLFGSATTISAFLLFSGFLSDFAAYSLAGLPRLSFSLTALVESGAAVMIDTFALMPGGKRGWVLLILVTVVVCLWAGRDVSLVRRLSRSRGTYHLVRLGLLFFALLLFTGMVDRVYRSLGTSTPEVSTEVGALQRAYAQGFPTPLEREFELERDSYELRYFRLPAWAAATRHIFASGPGPGARIPPVVLSGGLDEAVKGIPLRTLPQSRFEAKRVYGWLALSLVMLFMGLVLLRWWADELEALEASVKLAPAAAVSAPALVRMFRNLAAPIDRLIRPLTLLLTVLSIGLLPLTHGFLARSALGEENVMVYTKPGDLPKKKDDDHRSSGHEQPTTSSAATFLDEELPAPSGGGEMHSGMTNAQQMCSSDLRNRLVELASDVNKAMSDVVLVRRSVEGEEFEQKIQAFEKAMADLTTAVLDAGCGESIRTVWASRPPRGLAAQVPEVAEAFRRSLLAVSEKYGAKLGTILSHARDGQPLILVNSIEPRVADRGEQWSMQAMQSDSVAEVVVLPNAVRRRMTDLGQLLSASPSDIDTLRSLFRIPSPEALERVLTLIERRALHANGAGVSVTKIGGMAQVSALERPDLTTRAIDDLASLASLEDTAWWPEKNDHIRSSAVTALHLTGNPYAAFRLAELLEQEKKEGMPPRCPVDGKRLQPVHCLFTTPTAAGFLANDLTAEINRFVRLNADRSSPVLDAAPKVLLEARAGLLSALVNWTLVSVRICVMTFVERPVRRSTSRGCVRSRPISPSGSGTRWSTRTLVVFRFLRQPVCCVSDLSRSMASPRRSSCGMSC